MRIALSFPASLALCLAVTILTAGLFPGPLVAAQDEDDAAAIIQRAFEAARRNEILAREYVFHERIEEARFGRRGGEKKREAKTWDVTLFEGGSYRRLIAIDDRPLLPETEARERKRFQKHVANLQKETPRQRQRRMAKIEASREEGEAFLEEITKAFDFQMLGEEEIDGRATWVISAEPKAGYQPPDRFARIFTKVRAKLWVSQEEYAWVEAEIDTFGDFSWMGIYKLAAGTEVRFKQRKLDDEVWLTDSWSSKFRARIGFVYRVEAELSGSYSNFRRFRTETTETGFEPVEEEAPDQP